MDNVQLTLTNQERDYLVDLLQRVLKDMRVEEHRTRAPSYRENVLRDEAVLTALLSKLGKPPA